MVDVLLRHRVAPLQQDRVSLRRCPDVYARRQRFFLYRRGRRVGQPRIRTIQHSRSDWTLTESANRGSEIMSSRKTRTERARELRDFLISEHAGRCAICGSAEGLEMHLLISDGGKHHGLGFIDRVWFYFHQNELKNVKILCSGCHRMQTKIQNSQRLLRRASSRISCSTTSCSVS
jgi:5-methylcytosine-specific restriction endonuclease McrA